MYHVTTRVLDQGEVEPRQLSASGPKAIRGNRWHLLLRIFLKGIVFSKLVWKFLQRAFPGLSPARSDRIDVF